MRTVRNCHTHSIGTSGSISGLFSVSMISFECGEIVSYISPIHFLTLNFAPSVLYTQAGLCTGYTHSHIHHAQTTPKAGEYMRAAACHHSNACALFSFLYRFQSRLNFSHYSTPRQTLENKNFYLYLCYLCVKKIATEKRQKKGEIYQASPFVL